MTATRTLTPPAEAARFMASYAKGHSAGAFAMPTRKDIEQMQHRWGEWLEGPGWCAAAKLLSRDSVRRDYTGETYTLHGGTWIITHLAAEPTAKLPDLSRYRAVYAYVEDENVTAQLRDQGREVRAMRVSASSELIACWGLAGSGHAYPDVEAATIRRLPLAVGAQTRESVVREVQALRGWTDDYPFYSDGSWGALNLRGFKADDPQWGIKPAEMSKAWKAEHPEALAYRCDWTVLAERCPATVELVKETFSGFDLDLPLERVRLLQMAGRGGRGGKLARHTDVTDKAAGVQNGKIARFHIPIITHPSITMTGWNLDGRSAAVHLPEWSMWYLDARKPHAVVNPSGVDRVHLVVDVVSNPAVRAAIGEAVEHVA